jgi:hypothetical protein
MEAGGKIRPHWRQDPIGCQDNGRFGCNVDASTMNQIPYVERLLAVMREIERDLSTEHGPFQLFALFLPEESEGFWDIVVAAPWLRPYDKTSYSIIAKEVQSRVAPEDILHISRVALIDSSSESECVKVLETKSAVYFV